MSNINSYSPHDLERLETNTFIRRVEFHQQISSTNDRAMELAFDADEKFPLLVLAELQTAGRGRGTNTWWSDEGALTFSVMLATEAAQLPTERWPQVSLTVGLAVCEALEELLADGVPPTSRGSLPQAQLKWPNDVYIEGRKICGILVEVPRDCPGRLLLGIGINVNNSLSQAPEELQDMATSLCDLTGRQYSLTEVLERVLKQLSLRLEPNNLWNAQIREGWRKRCYLRGRRVQVDLGVNHQEGTCLGINDEGALMVDTGEKTVRCFAGVVTVGES